MTTEFKNVPTSVRIMFTAHKSAALSLNKGVLDVAFISRLTRSRHVSGHLNQPNVIYSFRKKVIKQTAQNTSPFTNKIN